MGRASDGRHLAVAAAALALLTFTYRWLQVVNATTVALSYLLIVLVVAATSRLRVAVLTSCLTMLCFNFFFLPPVGQFAIADSQNRVALVVFLAVSLALAGVVGASVERSRRVEEQKAGEVARRGEEMKSALLASLGHDLRTPLTAIRVAASNLQASWLAETDRREQTDVVLTEVERLTRLFEDILDMARIDAGAVSTEPQWVHPSQLVDAARDNLGRTLQQHHLEVRTDTDMLVRLDPRLTTAAVAQLLENAARYSPDGSGIDVDIGLEGDELLISVRDRGPGIAAPDLARLFDRFYRGAGARTMPGTGMGLSIARGLLAVEHGRVWAENCPDGGARFTIAVPVERRALEVQA